MRNLDLMDANGSNSNSPGFPQGERTAGRPQALREERAPPEGKDIPKQDWEAAGGRVLRDVNRACLLLEWKARDLFSRCDDRAMASQDKQRGGFLNAWWNWK